MKKIKRGRDGEVRNATIEIAGGKLLNRPINMFSRLEITEENSESSTIKEPEQLKELIPAQIKRLTKERIHQVTGKSNPILRGVISLAMITMLIQQASRIKTCNDCLLFPLVYQKSGSAETIRSTFSYQRK
ncbi:hypothetical protein LOAG_18203 [Loa loa]|uniref:Uncharacterized protein n=1 Tax=Loa loa TaxID=7209 RepID=A0A1S0UFX5_LOALO|nr:hypothetical protein LOAG_18203 [Loa loa]EJD74489.1 hypothetical protein LOAG_18203 [Loa loa]